jgi:hypothetical protein
MKLIMSDPFKESIDGKPATTTKTATGLTGSRQMACRDDAEGAGRAGRKPENGVATRPVSAT